jgi:glycosyltransferase involved in cell wall biosynthesis
MRVALLGQYPLDEERIVGGVEAVVTRLLRALAAFADMDVQVVTCQPEQLEREERTTSGWPLHVLTRRRLGRVSLHWRDIRGMVRKVRGIAPDVVHAQGMGLYAGAAIRSGCPHVVTTHGIFSREAAFSNGSAARLRGLLDSAIERHWISRVANVISISPYVEEELGRLGGFRGRVYPIENPVADEFFALEPGRTGRVILYAGRVIPRKDLMTLLRALARLREGQKDVELRIAGETDSAPEYFEQCQRFVRDHSLGSAVTFLGTLRTTELVQEYDRCALVALPSIQETAPMAVAEAMASGRAVLATRVCGVPYMVEDGKSGLLVEAGNDQAMAEALARLLNGGKLQEKMGMRGREIACQRFKADVVARRTREAYLKIAGVAGDPGPCSELA